MAIYSLKHLDGSLIVADSKERSILFLGKKAFFSKAEWMILKGLHFHNGEVTSRENLLLLLNDEHKEDSRVVDMHISSIRKKIKPLNLVRIKSIYGKGYKLVLKEIN